MAMLYPSDELIIGESCGVSKKESHNQCSGTIADV
jgi:hypothetical protein